MGKAEQISAMAAPTNMVKKPTISHPYTMEIVPPYVSPVLNSVVIPVRMEMMAKENAKFDTTLVSNQAQQLLELPVLSRLSAGALIYF